VPHVNGQTCTQQHSIPDNLPHSRALSDFSQVHNLPGPCPSDSIIGEAQVDKARCGLLSSFVVLFAALLSAGLIRSAILTLWIGLAGIYYLRVRSQATRLLDLTPVRLYLSPWRFILTGKHTVIVFGNSRRADSDQHQLGGHHSGGDHDY